MTENLYEIETLDEPEEEEVYVRYDVATYPSDLTLTGIHELWKQEAYKLGKLVIDCLAGSMTR